MKKFLSFISGVTEFIADFLELIILGAVAAVLLFSVIVAFCYMEGSAKSEWLMQTRGIEMPWYRAAFLDFQVSDMRADLNIGDRLQPE